MNMAQIPKGSTPQEVSELLMKSIKITSDLSIMKFFSLQTIYTSCEHLYITKIK